MGRAGGPRAAWEGQVGRVHVVTTAGHLSVDLGNFLVVLVLVEYVLLGADHLVYVVSHENHLQRVQDKHECQHQVRCSG